MSCVCMRTKTTTATKDKTRQKRQRDREREREKQTKIERGRCFLNRLQNNTTHDQFTWSCSRSFCRPAVFYVRSYFLVRLNRLVEHCPHPPAALSTKSADYFPLQESRNHYYRQHRYCAGGSKLQAVQLIDDSIVSFPWALQGLHLVFSLRCVAHAGHLFIYMTSRKNFWGIYCPSAAIYCIFRAYIFTINKVEGGNLSDRTEQVYISIE